MKATNHQSFSAVPGNYLALRLALLVFLAGCGDEEQKADQSSAVKRNAPKIETADAEEKVINSPKTLNLLCESIHTLSSTPTQLDEHAKKLCSSEGKPTSLMVNKMPKVAFTGSGDPQLLLLEEPEHDNDALTTRLLVGGAVKLPISAKKYFDSATLLMDDRKRAQELGVKLVGGMKKMDVLDEFEAQETYHIKSWKTHVIVERDVNNQVFVSEYQSTQEHFEIVPEKVYLVSTYLDKAIKGIIDTRMITAIVQFKSEAYVFAIIEAKTENHGLPTVASQEMGNVLREGLSNAHANAAIFGDL